MDSTQIIQLMGVMYFVFGLAFIFNKKYYKTLFKDLSKSKAFLLVSGYVSFTIGFVLVLFFSEWSLSKDGLITLIAWIALVKGIVLILCPTSFSGIVRWAAKDKHFFNLGMMVTFIGLLLMYLGFMG